ncbi:MAG: HIT family protein [Nanoarchaeota archaeon]|nr:HIT family protein [Nanoarchaeota archaeon]MBU1004712.1 HIT family protein [Nanoarchaeota archaeon]MBU1945758.1 HIT family protein [Nanoarchaeota archaeon]
MKKEEIVASKCIQQKSKISEHAISIRNCIFCRIVKGEIPCARIFEDDKVISFLDISPANKGHALIVTKGHYETLLEIPDEVLLDVMSKAKKIARAMSSALGNKGFNIVMNNGKAAGQIVPHAHIHIIPRFDRDGMNVDWKHKKYNDKEIDEFRGKITRFL